MTKKRLNQKFVYFFTIFVVFFIAYHLLIWYFITSKIFNTSPYYIGDLGRMSYQIHSLFPRLEQITLPRRHFEGSNWHNEPIDLITLGDSFSNGMGSGKNPYYQDYLSSSLHINILNIQNLDNSFNYIDTIRYLYKNNWLRKIHPKAILIQCVERETLNHVPAKNNRFHLEQDAFNASLFKTNFTREFPHPTYINTANYKAPYFYIIYKYKLQGNNEVYKFPLLRNFFTVHDANQLLVYHDDLNNIDNFTETSVVSLNHELNQLAEELKKNGTTLLFMPVVDKYDLYYDHIINKDRYPKNRFFPLIRKLPKKYVFIDTKAILSPLLKKGIQDLYYADDTHWSFIAAEHIANDKNFLFLKNKGN